MGRRSGEWAWAEPLVAKRFTEEDTCPPLKDPGAEGVASENFEDSLVWGRREEEVGTTSVREDMSLLLDIVHSIT